jgi:hypothetical protein
MYRKRSLEAFSEVHSETEVPLAHRRPAAHVIEVRCSVCDRPLLRTVSSGGDRAIMTRCRHCRALQHRRV